MPGRESTNDYIEILRVKLRRALDQLPYLPRALALVWTAARYWTLAWGILLVLQGLLPIGTVYLTRAIVDSLVAAMATGHTLENITPTLILAGIMAGVLLASELLRGVSGWIRTTQSELVQDHVSGLIHAQSMRVDFAFYEMPTFYDRLHRARSEASYRPLVLLENLGGLVQSSITVIAMALVIVPYGLWLPAALLVSALPAIYIVFHYTLRQHEWRMQVTIHERRTWYYDWLLTSGQAAAELRLFGLGAYFQSAFRALRRHLRRERLKLSRDQTLAELGAGAVALAITGAAMAWMVWRALQGQASLGDLTLLYQAFNQGQSLVRSLLGNVGQIYSNSLFLGNLFEFLALEPGVVDPSQPVPAPNTLREGICFRDVSFRYPLSERTALQSLNLTIPVGQLAAIVGPNGAGKSTLAKLLCRLYDPDSGSIAVDGIDLRAMRLGDLRDVISVLPQEYTHYCASVAENIMVGEQPAIRDTERTRLAARGAMADGFIEQLPKGYETLLGTWFEGGTDLSVGEYQRIALARALARPAPILILDEPTSAMDPWAEAEWLTSLKELVKGRIAIIITHRLTTAMCCDVIHVMQGGHIVESGDHAHLLHANGRYAQLWTGQAQSASPFGSNPSSPNFARNLLF